VLTKQTFTFTSSVLVGREFSGGSYQDLVNWYRSLLTRRTVCGRAAGNTPRTQKRTEWNKSRNCTNSALEMQDHCNYKERQQSANNKSPFQ